MSAIEKFCFLSSLKTGYWQLSYYYCLIAFKSKISVIFLVPSSISMGQSEVSCSLGLNIHLYSLGYEFKKNTSLSLRQLIVPNTIFVPYNRKIVRFAVKRFELRNWVSKFEEKGSCFISRHGRIFLLGVSIHGCSAYFL